MLAGPEQAAPGDLTSDSEGASPRAVPELPYADVLARAEILGPENRLRLIAAIWTSLPPWHPAAPSPRNLSELRAHLNDFDAGCVDKFPWKFLQEAMAGEVREMPTKVYAAPRRFDLATILIVTFAYSLL